MLSNNIIISGVTPLSLNDYPNEMSYVIFLGGCNFRCPYCHNASVVNKTTEEISPDYVINDLKKRKEFVDAVVITGGEPTIYGQALIDFIRIIQSLGFKIKLDTNGSNPELLNKIVKLKIVDFIAMDIKNTFEKYSETCGVKVNIDSIKKSIKIIETSEIAYEFRSTINKTHHTFKDIEEMKSYVKDNFILQEYKYNKNQIKDIDFISYSDEEIKELQNKLKVEAKV